MSLDALPDLLVEPLVRAALAEDLGRAGDITSAAIFPEGTSMRAVMATRKAGVLAGIQTARIAFALLDPRAEIEILKQDGAKLAQGDQVLRVSGDARAVLGAERVALNFVCRLSGIATATAQWVEAVKPHKARIACTRKTTPGLRALEKYAVRAGGGVNHRYGLDDAVLIKDNHIAVSGSVRLAIERARAAVGHLVKIEVEVDTLAQLDEALSAGVDAVLLDNMPTETLREAVRKVGGRAITEASGGVTLASVQAVAATGVDIISAGWLTHSAPILDLGLDVL